MTEAYIYAYGRTAFGRYGGSLANTRPDDMLAHVIHALVERCGFEPGMFEDVIAGCTNQAGEDSRNVARMAGLLSGLSIETGGITVNRLCGSSLAASLDAARAVRCREGELFIAGGVESMSRAPLVVSKPTSGFDRGQKLFDTTMGPRFSNPGITQLFGSHTMPETAENIAADLGITREESDLFALSSQQKYEAAKASNFFVEEIVPIEVAQGHKKPPRVFAEDEHPRPQATLEALSGLRPIFEGGQVTAGNASGINDGATALIIGNREAGEQTGISPRAKFLSGAIAGVEPRVMGLGPVPASRKALKRAGLKLGDMDVIEINEAFAVQVLGCLSQLGLPYDDPRVNPNGGAVAIGHPLGASGARILMTALRELERKEGRYALVTMCIGLGQGVAAVIERV
jgi:acetyl-CoA C-acetyltransferase